MTVENEKPEAVGWEVVPDTEVETQEQNPAKVEAEKPQVPEQGKEFGKRAEQRIRQLVKRAKTAEELAAAAQAKIGEFEAELNQAREAIARINQGAGQASREQVQSQYLAARQKLLTAKEAGDSRGEVEAIEAMTQAQARWNQVQAPPAAPAKPKEESRQVQQAPQVHPQAQKWIDAASWWEEDDVARGAAIAVAQKLERQGLDPDDDEYYEELDKVLSKKFPEHYAQGGEVEEKPVQRPKQTVAGGSRTSGQPDSRVKVKLTEGQVKMAQRLGLPVEVYAEEVRKYNEAKGGPMEVTIRKRS